MAGINKVFLIGEVQHNPEITREPDGTVKASFILLTSEQRRTPRGHVFDHEEHIVVLKNNAAEQAAKVLTPGKLVSISGSIRTKEFIDNQAIKRFLTEIHGQSFVLLGRLSDF